MKTIYTLAFLIMTAFLQAQNPDQSAIQQEFRLAADSISFPLTLVNAFPFISGEVNGVKGKFMFDTGKQEALEINNNMVPLSSQRESGNGFVASGQKFKVYTNDTIKEVRLVNGLHFQNLKQIESANLDFLQNRITPDCIGYIGFDFFEGYLFKLDYIKRKLTFYKNTSVRELSKDFLNGEKILAILDFEIRNQPNIPIIKMKVTDIDILGLFDTGGSYGLLAITDNDAKKLIREKNLINYGKDGYGTNLFSLNKVKMDADLVTDFIAIDKFEGDFSPVRKAIGLTEDNFLLIAHRFFAKFKTVWDYKHKRIYVLKY
ncbi:hypothetical protein FUA48_11865 [Flavobacterium alkalisoli]|uniref:Aspartyl protease n=1 Tax=Flavobacterium alkalisoli TaxID=2602769 RepID=A0A5B9FWT6_9FLAO|nr:hypothetical protein [Flavobacterium alkalisoli]QEE50248.1 hypothetical protein FUA48_11865 [Flavobacterium alkalisoli]